MRILPPVVMALMLFPLGSAYAYEPSVHQKITVKALEQSARGVDYKARLGIRLSESFGGKLPETWVSDGAEREDDIWDSYPFFRSLHHFLDPVHLEPLTIGKWPACTNNASALFGLTGLGFHTTRADEWALHSQPLNAWGLPRARGFQKEALLGPNPGTRDQNMAFLFRSLGHMVHLVQDMAQPEHTRNDQHLPVFPGAIYETYTGEIIGGAEMPAVAHYFESYDTVVLPTFQHYFTHPDGRGMADFSNRSFVTQDTNYGDQAAATRCFEYDFPRIEDAQPRIEVVTERPLDDFGAVYEVQVLETVFTSHTFDLYRQTSDVDAYHTLYSAFDAEIRKYDPAKQVYSLNNFSYDMRAAILLPQATGYSAGFIDHFFRGTVEAKWKKLQSGPYVYELTVQNTAKVPIGADARLSVIYRADPAYFNRTNSDDTAVIFMNEPLASLVPGFSGLAPGESASVHVPPVFGLKTGDSITEFERRIVVEGTLDTEAGTVISLVQPANASSKFVAEALWDGQSFLSLVIEEFADAEHTQRLLNNQACYNPATGNGCLGCCGTMEHVTILSEEAGKLAIGIEPRSGRHYSFTLNSSSRTAKAVDVRFTLDGEVLMEGTLVVPGCTQTTFCHSQLQHIFSYDVP